MFPDERVVRMIEENFIPARLHVRDDAADFTRYGEQYGVHWTPITLILDPDGKERHRVEGFVDADEYLAQLALGLARLAFARSDWRAAHERFGRIAEEHPRTEAAAEALYWAGASKYKMDHDSRTLARTHATLTERYPNSPWARKASVWRKVA